MVEIDKTEDENDGWPKVSENQTNHVVTTGINRPVTVTQHHLLRNNGCHTMKITVHGELNIYFSFHGKQFCKITVHGFYGNHDSRGKN